MAVMEQTTEARKKHEARKRFELLLAALLAGWGLLIAKRRSTIIGAILHLAGSDGIIPARQLPYLKALIDTELGDLAVEIYTSFADAYPAAVLYGAQLGGADYASAAVKDRSVDLFAFGYRGVSFSDVVVKDARQALVDVVGKVGRAILETNIGAINKLDSPIEDAITRFVGKAQAEAVGHLSAAFNLATRETVMEQTKPGTRPAFLRYVVSPQAETHCSWCGSKDGRLYRADDEVWGELPRHRNCACYGEPTNG